MQMWIILKTFRGHHFARFQILILIAWSWNSERTESNFSYAGLDAPSLLAIQQRKIQVAAHVFFYTLGIETCYQEAPGTYLQIIDTIKAQP